MTPAEAVSDGSYYTKSENYYDAGALGDPYWFGKGAEALGLDGKVDPAEFQRLLDGRLPDGTVLGRVVNDERQHFPGWDLTFSVPKSVSIMALVGGDKRLIDAIHEAAKEAMSWVEEKATYSRFGEQGKTVARPTGNLVTAMFMHDLSRAEEPLLHIHAVTANATRGPDGEWRSIDGRYFYGYQKPAGLIFRQALAHIIRRLGRPMDVETKEGTFELSEVPKGLIDNLSTRSRQIEGHIAKEGLTRDTASAAQLKEASLITRAPKEKNIDRVAKARAWNQAAKEHGFAFGEAGAGSNGPIDQQQSEQQINDKAVALEAVRLAATVLAEKEITFHDIKLNGLARVYAQGRADKYAIRGAIQQLEKVGFLQARQVDQYFRPEAEHIKVQGWTTTQAVETEKDLIKAEKVGRKSQSRITGVLATSKVVDQAAKSGTHWEPDHKLALCGLLSNENRIVALDGTLERTANRQLIASYVEGARAKGFDVRILAPSSAGASNAGALLNQPATTIASQLIDRRPKPPRRQRNFAPYKVPGLPRMRLPAPKAPEPNPQIWMVADTAQLRPAAARDLFRAAERQNARVILMMEDRAASKNMPSSIRTLLNAGMSHVQMPGHHEQDRNEMHLAVAALARGEPSVALEHIEKAGGRIVSIGPKSRSRADQDAALQQRRDYIADRYAYLADDDRTNTRVLDLTSKGKDALNAEIRERLKASGEISGPALNAEILIAKFLTDTERQIAVNYAPDDVVRFGRAQAQTDTSPAIGRGDYFDVAKVETQKGVVMLLAADGRLVTWEPAKWGAEDVSVFRTAERELSAGDKITWTRNDAALGIRAQQRDTVAGIHPESGTFSVERGDRIVEVDPTKARHFDHAYAGTVGKNALVADKIIAHVPADNVERANLRTLIELASQAKQLTIVTENQRRLSQSAEDRPGLEPAALDGPIGLSAAALDATRIAIDVLAERSAVFAREDLVIEASKQGLTVLDREEVEAAVNALAESGDLISRQAKTIDPGTKQIITTEGWTTPRGVREEQQMMDAEERGRFAFQDKPILEKTSAISFVQAMATHAKAGQEWTAEQHVAAVGLLSSPHRVTGLQGLAGTAKTTTVLLTLAGAAKGQGHNVMAIAPTTDASLKLGSALNIDVSKTVAKHLVQVNRVSPADAEKSPVWLVDEASMVSTRDMRTLIRAAEQHDARLFLASDLLQLGSVGAGRAAGQLIENGMTTQYLDHILRQSGNPHLQQAIYHTIDKQPMLAIRHIVKGGGEIHEIKKEAKRHQAMAKEYIGRSWQHRANTIIIDPTRDGVKDVSEAIRLELNKKGELTGTAITATLLQDANLTTPERHTHASYKRDHVVHFPQRSDLGQNQVIEAGRYLTVDRVKGRDVVLKDKDGKTFIWEPRAQPLTVEVYGQEKQPIQVGERIRFTRMNDSIDAVSGRLATVVRIDSTAERIQIQHDSKNGNPGSLHWLSLRDREQQHFGYGWAVTTNRAQGTTASVIANVPSWRLNTVNLTSFLVMITRAPSQVVIMIDDGRKLTQALSERGGEKEASLDQMLKTAGDAERLIRDRARDMADQLFQKQPDPTPPMQQPPQQQIAAPTQSRELGGRDR